MFCSGALFEVTDGELDRGVFSMELVGFDRRHVGVGGDEGVVAPVVPEAALGSFGEPGPAYDQANCSGLGTSPGGVGRLGDLGLAADGVVDVGPGVFVDCGDRGLDVGVEAHGDRPADAMGVEVVAEFRGPEPRIGADCHCAGRSGPFEVGGEFVNEADHTACGVRGAFAHPGEQHLAGAGPGREQQVIAQDSGVAVTRALLVFGVDFTDRRVQIHDQRLVAGSRTQ